MNTFDFIQMNLARHLLPELSEDPVRDTITVLTMNHQVLSKQNKISPSRLTGWAIVGPNASILQANVQVVAEGITTGDQRTRYEAWADALSNFEGPLCLIQFTKAAFNISNLYLTHDTRVTRICSPEGVETFDFTQVPEKHSGVAHKNIYKWSQKIADR